MGAAKNVVQTYAELLKARRENGICLKKFLAAEGNARRQMLDLFRARQNGLGKDQLLLKNALFRTFLLARPWFLGQKYYKAQV